MQPITSEVFDNLQFVTRYASKEAHPIIAEADKLSVGQGLIIHINEWGLKTTVGNYLASHKLLKGKKKFTVRTLADRSGWAVLRVA